jgi:hypothetical protein
MSSNLSRRCTLIPWLVAAALLLVPAAGADEIQPARVGFAPGENAVFSPPTSYRILTVPELLRNDAWPTEPMDAIFTGNTCPTPRSTDTSLDPEGPDCNPEYGEITLPEPGSGDLDDLYSDEIEETEAAALLDSNRPLIFYQVEDPGGGGVLRLGIDPFNPDLLIMQY